MFAKLSLFALCALSMVDASPYHMECANNLEAGLTEVDLSMKVEVALQPIQPVQLINMGFDGVAYVPTHLELGRVVGVFHRQVVPSQARPAQPQWMMYRDPMAPDQLNKFIIKNIGMDAWLFVGEYGMLTVRSGLQPSEATVFTWAQSGSGPDEKVIKLPDADRVWEAIRFGGKVINYLGALRPADGGEYQHWKFSMVEN
ncbi:hypothetical protein DFH06DRAFT_155012 [Mycena polygramma]|nr:hypothetical protein DFH06DRAFT_155012 [Mycena polygramma]